MEEKKEENKNTVDTHLTTIMFPGLQRNSSQQQPRKRIKQDKEQYKSCAGVDHRNQMVHWRAFDDDVDVDEDGVRRGVTQGYCEPLENSW